MNTQFKQLIGEAYGESAPRSHQRYNDLIVFPRSDPDEVPVRSIRVRLARDGDHITIGRWVLNGDGWRQRQTPLMFSRDEIAMLIQSLQAALQGAQG